MAKLLTLILVSLSVGLGNFAASVGIGLSGVSKRLRLQLCLIFGLFETGMPIVGLLVGHQIASSLGSHTNVIGGGLLVLTGLYIALQALAQGSKPHKPSQSGQSLHKLLLAGLALSIDNLIVGFSLGTTKEPILVTALVIGVTSIVLTLLGLELGGHLKSRIERYSELLSGLVLILVGLAVSLKIL